MRPAVAMAVRQRARWPLPIGPAVAVMAWHRVDADGGRLAIPPTVFARQLEILDANRERFPVVGIDQAGSVFASPRRHARGVVLTFDDAWADNHTNALSPLRRYGMPATLYVPSRLLGKPGYMTVTQVREMDSGGVTVGAHSRTHPDLRACSDGELEREVRGSKEDLEDLLGKPVTSFAYPVGLLNDRVVTAVEAAGFSSAVTSHPGWWRPRTGALRIPRGFPENFSDATFRAAVAGGLNVLSLFDAMKTVTPWRSGAS